MRMLDQVEKGEDPRADKEAKQKAARLIFHSVVQQFVDHKAQTVRPATHGANVLYLQRPQYFGPLHRMPLHKITQSHVAERLDAIRRNSGEVSARQARRHLAALFVWCMKRGHCTANPVIGTEEYKAKSADGRERCLKDTELAAVWNAVDGGTDYGRIVRLLICTGTRRNEVGSMKWDELKEDTWTIPGERTKNKRAHTLPIIPMAAQIIGTVLKRRDFLFGILRMECFETAAGREAGPRGAVDAARYS
jgi:integrase